LFGQERLGEVVSEEIDGLVKDMRAGGLRVTPQRLAIYRHLRSSKRHPTAHEIFEAVKKDYPSITISTVYKTLEMLVELGRARELGFSSLGTRYEANTNPHLNLVCEDCGSIEDLEGLPSMDGFMEQVRSRTEFQIRGQRTELYGLCRRCQGSPGRQ
jgi:Fur family transcriptional regulator, peroxide stress response regulator